ncbi:hypothetical protein BU17DRAFT_42625, partial [Hysterangium stoloniferum]
KVFHILAKSHKMTIFLNAPVATTIGDLKAQALTGLVQFAKTDEDADMPFPAQENDAIPKVTSVGEFELCRARRERGQIVEFEILDTKSTIRDTLKNWEIIYFKFRNAAGACLLFQVLMTRFSP